MKTILMRIFSPTPKFFRQLRNTALIIGAIASGFATGGVAPAVMGTIGIISGTVVTVSQLVTQNEDEECTPSNK